MEQLLHYVWKHKLFPLRTTSTAGDTQIEVIDTGLHNTDAGPDFFNAKVKIDGTLWVGNVEIHCKASEWFAHGHHKDPRYNNVILHVVAVDDATVTTSNGHTVTQTVIGVPADVAANYDELLSADRYPPCHRLIPVLPSIMIHSWMSALQTERLEQKTEALAQRAMICNGSWEDAFFITLARNYGFGTNGDAFETWTAGNWLRHAAHHRDDLFQIEALFMGQAGLLCPESIPERRREAALQDDYFNRLRNEYRFLANKFALQPMDHSIWKFLRMRPQNFPHIRLAQLASLYHSRRASISRMAECESIDDLRALMQTSVTPYWRTHYSFGLAGKDNAKHLSARSIDLLIINTAIPTLFAYGRHRRDERLCRRATDMLEQLQPEDNNVVRMWNECGLKAQNAGDSQALIQLKKQYCDRKYCLRCRIGYEYLKSERQ